MKKIIEKWYKELGFPSAYDEPFYALLSAYEEKKDISAESYAPENYDAAQNLLHYLFMCENAERGYLEKGISLDILRDTLKDLPFYTSIWSEIHGELCLAGEYDWLKRHLGMRLFRLGRLQFCMAKCEHSIPEKNLCEGDNVIEIHIPAGEPLDKSACLASVAAAKEFFAKFFPEFRYKHFTCDSWLLDTTLCELLRPDSNIIDFQGLFDIVARKKSDRILRYIFKWDSKRDTVRDAICKSSFARLIKERALAGGDFYEALGVLKP